MVDTRIIRLVALALAPMLGLAALGGAARAQDGGDLDCEAASDFRCGFQVKELHLQKVPAVLKFQARVSQAKLPLGEGVFGEVWVKLLRGVEVVCAEQFHDVIVKDSVINLEIGRHMDCELDEVVAENGDLAFQICPGGPENCLQPVHLASTAYAIKSSFATVALEANRANLAGLANYAHRMTADRDMLTRKTIGAGYFDFYTPTVDKVAELYPDPAAFAGEANGGFIAWTPTRDRGALALHLAGKRHESDRLTELDSLHLVAEDTLATGDLTVAPSPTGAGLTVTARGAHVTGDSQVDGALDLTRALTVASGGAHVTGDSKVTGELTVGDRTTVASGGAAVVGDSNVSGALTVSQMLTVLSGGASITGPTDIAGTLLVHGAVTVLAGGLHVTGDSSVSGRLAVTQGLAIASGGLVVTSGGARVSSGGVEVTAGGATVTGDGRFVGRLTAQDIELTGPVRALDALGRSHRFFALDGTQLAVNPDESLDATHVAGQVRFTGPVFFDDGTVDPDQAENFVLAHGESRDLVFGGELTVLHALSAPAGVRGGPAGLDVAGGVTVHGGLTVPDGITGGLAVTGALGVSGAATLTGAVAMPGGIAGAAAVSGALAAGGLAVSGGTTFNGPVSFPGGITGAAAFAGRLTLPSTATLRVAGPTTLAGVTVGGALQANAAAALNGATTFASAVAGNTTFNGALTASAATVFGGPTSLASDLVVDGATRFNGPVAFGGAFTGTTGFESIGVSGSITVNGASTFNGKTSFPGGVTGSVALNAVNVTSGLTVSGWTILEDAAAFNGQVTGLDNLPAYIKANGESRGVSLGGDLAIAGDATLQGSFALGGGLAGLDVEHLRVTTNATAYGDASFGDMKIDGDLILGDALDAGGCRVCLNYSDNRGDDTADRKHACVRLADGEDSGMMGLSGNVDDNDVFGVVYICDGGGSEHGSGWIF